MRFHTLRNKNKSKEILFFPFFIAILLIILLPNILAEYYEFDSTEIKEKINLSANNYKAIDFSFHSGKEIEILYTIQVKQDLPIDIWFVNEDNYLLLTAGAQFLYFMDGTEQHVSYAKKVITLKEHGDYKLILTNYYSNQTVEVEISGEVRTFKSNSEENTFEFSSFLVFIFITITIILVIIVGVFGFKIRELKRSEVGNPYKNSFKKLKKNRNSSRESKNKFKTKTKGKDKNKSKHSDKKKKENRIEKPGFCGYCGEPVDTPYCRYCGQKI